MSYQKKDGVNSLCQKALHIVNELCFAGQVEREKCSGIISSERSSQGAGSTGKWRRTPLASPSPAGAPRAPQYAPGSGASRAALGASLGRGALLPCSFLPLSSWLLGARTVRVLSPRLQPPAPSTSLVCSRPAVSLPGFRTPSPRTPTPRVSLRSGAASAGGSAGTARCRAVLSCPRGSLAWGRGREGQSVLGRKELPCTWNCLGLGS